MPSGLGNPTVIQTALQPGRAWRRGEERNRFNVPRLLSSGNLVEVAFGDEPNIKTVETAVWDPYALVTGLKPGVNEKVLMHFHASSESSILAGQIIENPRPMSHNAMATTTVITSQNFQKLPNAGSHPG